MACVTDSKTTALNLNTKSLAVPFVTVHKRIIDGDELAKIDDPDVRLDEQCLFNVVSGLNMFLSSRVTDRLACLVLDTELCHSAFQKTTPLKCISEIYKYKKLAIPVFWTEVLTSNQPQDHPTNHWVALEVNVELQNSKPRVRFHLYDSLRDFTYEVEEKHPVQSVIDRLKHHAVSTLPKESPVRCAYASLSRPYTIDTTPHHWLVQPEDDHSSCGAYTALALMHIATVAGGVRSPQTVKSVRNMVRRIVLANGYHPGATKQQPA